MQCTFSHRRDIKRQVNWPAILAVSGRQCQPVRKIFTYTWPIRPAKAGKKLSFTRPTALWASQGIRKTSQMYSFRPTWFSSIVQVQYSSPIPPPALPDRQLTQSKQFSQETFRSRHTFDFLLLGGRLDHFCVQTLLLKRGFSSYSFSFDNIYYIVQPHTLYENWTATQV